MTRETAKLKIRMSVTVNKDNIKSLEKADEIIDQIYNDHEAQLKTKDEEIKELGEIVQQYLIPSKNYDAIIKAKDDEIERLKEHITHAHKRGHYGH